MIYCQPVRLAGTNEAAFLPEILKDLFIWIVRLGGVLHSATPMHRFFAAAAIFRIGTKWLVQHYTAPSRAFQAQSGRHAASLTYIAMLLKIYV